MTGSPQNAQRADTAPLRRDNSRVNQEHRSASATDFSAGTLGGPGETTRPAFQQPAAAAQQPAAAAQQGAQQPTSQHPTGGQAASGPHTPHGGVPHAQQAPGTYVQHQPTQQHQGGWGAPHGAQHPPQQAYGQPYGAAQQYPQQGYGQQAAPHGGAQQGGMQQGGAVQQGGMQQGGPPQNTRQSAGAPGSGQRGPADGRRESGGSRPATGLAGTSITPVGWALRGLVLVGVAVVSGLVWMLIQPSGPTEEEAAQDPGKPGTPTTQNQFTVELREEGQQGCANVSTGKIKEFFGDYGCEHLTRALYTTTLPDGQRVLTSVVTVRMADSGAAAQLNELVTRDNTGNVMDLVSAGRDLPDDFPGLSSDVGYYSEQQDRLVVVGESGYFSQPDNYEDQRLTEVTRDALRLGWPQDSG
ncbi:hypothetical protein ACL03H_16200 [Saccharopolyspora sp. MS10]|uniref:hypothetical protein n=1 Tax=Saccharopolyspora sp. MS10 TaxID=3385973 RepID=UPI0039A23D3E